MKSRLDRVKFIFQSFLLILFIAVVSIVIYDMYINIEVDNLNKETKIEPQKITESQLNVDNVENDTGNLTIIEKASKTVVGISKLQDNGLSIFNVNSTKELGLGSGIIVSENGYILTNQHVAGNKYNKNYITLYNGEEIEGTVVWADENLDLAILKIEKNGLDYAKLGNSENIQLGQNVFAIGNPIGFEFQRTVTSGIISAKDRSIKVEEGVYMSGLIQTDAVINPGNSGGPLITKNGEVIGINSVKIDTAEGIGFAIPINVVKPVIEKFVEEGEFKEATLGIFAYDKNVIPYLNSRVKFETGIYVANIKIGGSAEKSGVQIGDIITQIDGKNINKMNELRQVIYNKSPNEEVSLIINRNNKEIEIKVILDNKI